MTGNNKVWRKFNFAAVTTSKIKVLINDSADHICSRLTEVEAWGNADSPPPRTNAALSSNGGTATASSTYNGYSFSTGAVIDGEHKGLNWLSGGGWNDATTQYPDWLEVDFSGSKTIDEIDVYTVQDDYANPSEPTETTTFSTYGNTAFQVQYWNGSAFVDVPGGNVTGNHKVWRKFNFAALTTSKIKVLINDSADHIYSRLTEVEAWTATSGSSSLAQIHWLVTDQLGTPRMIFDQSGSLATVSRHDYLPFGEELFGGPPSQPGAGGRLTTMGYTNNDGARQKFTQKERDNETGLDFFKARYYGSPQGRFTSPDPYNIIFEKEKGRDKEEKDEILTIYISNPQVWNRYTYTLNNPLNVVDPDGRRALTRQEEQDIEKLRKQAEGKSAADAKAINNAADAMVNAIHAVRTGQKDPQGLGIALKAIHQIGNTRYGYQGAGLSVSRNGITIHATSGEWKCNIFVAAMHIVGVPTGLGPNGFPTVTGQHGEDLAPSANQLGNKNIPLGHLPVVTGSPQMGDVVAFPTNHGLGHSSD